MLELKSGGGGELAPDFDFKFGGIEATGYMYNIGFVSTLSLP